MTLIDYFILTGIQLIITTLIGFWFKNYFPAYFKKKGENLATKEDIGEITKIVKYVEVNLNKELEKFKSDLSIEREFSTKRKFEERDAILKFWDSISILHLNLVINKYENMDYSTFLNNKNIFEDFIKTSSHPFQLSIHLN